VKVNQNIFVRTALGVVIVGLVLGTGAVLLFQASGREWVNATLLPQVELTLSQNLKRKVTLGEVKELLPWQITLDATEVQGLATVRQVAVRFNLWQVLNGQPLPIGLTLTEPSLVLKQRRNSQWEVADLLQDLAPSANQPVTIQQVRIVGGQVTIIPYLTPRFILSDLQGWTHNLQCHRQLRKCALEN
jgi:hypothetical protein